MTGVRPPLLLAILLAIIDSSLSTFYENRSNQMPTFEEFRLGVRRVEANMTSSMKWFGVAANSPSLLSLTDAEFGLALENAIADAGIIEEKDRGAFLSTSFAKARRCRLCYFAFCPTSEKSSNRPLELFESKSVAAFIEWRANYIVANGDPLLVQHPHRNGASLAGDLMTLALTLDVNSLHHGQICQLHLWKHRYSPLKNAVPGSAMAIAQEEAPCIDSFLLDLEVRVSLDGGPETRGSLVEMTSVPFHGLSAGPHYVTITLGLRQDIWNTMNSKRANACSCNKSFGDTKATVSDLAVIARAERNFTMKTQPIQPTASLGLDHTCGSFVDDSQWCSYTNTACVDLNSFVLSVPGFESPGSARSSFLRDLDNKTISARPDDRSFIPWSLDWNLSTASIKAVPMLPHRSGALARISSSAIRSGNETAWLSGITGFLAIDSPENVFHAASKAFDLSYAIDASHEVVTRNVDRIIPVTCDRRFNRCVLVSHVSKKNEEDTTANSTAAGAFLDGILRILFGENAKIIHDKQELLEAPKKKQQQQAAISSICFEKLIIAGESRALFRGPADARRFRHRARLYFDLPPIHMAKPPPRIVIVQRRRRDNRLIANIDEIVAVAEGLMSFDIPVSASASASSGSFLSLLSSPVSSASSSSSKSVPVQVVVLEDLSFKEQAILFLQGAGIVVLVHGAAVANLAFLPPGAGVIELKQYGEFGTQPRDISAAAQLHHWSLRNPAMPSMAHRNSCHASNLQCHSNEFSSGNKSNMKRSKSSARRSPMVRPGMGMHAGAPMSFCRTMAYHPAIYDVTVDVVRFRETLRDALAATGIRPIYCDGYIDERQGAGGARDNAFTSW